VNLPLLYAASGLTGLWGIAHLFATGEVVAGFSDPTPDNRHIITMEWIVEGVALVSLAAFVLVATLIEPQSALASAVFAVAAGTLLVLALVSLFTGFRVGFFPYKLCPFIFVVSAALIVWGVWW